MGAPTEIQLFLIGLAIIAAMLGSCCRDSEIAALAGKRLGLDGRVSEPGCD